MRRVLITGASSDIGLALARRYLQAGWSVLAHVHSSRPEIDALRGERLEVWSCDFSDIARLEERLDAAPGVLDEMDAFVNLAARLTPVSFADARVSDILDALGLNLLPGLLLMRRLGPAMAERGFGRIVHGSSIGVKFGGGRDSFCYSLSKHAQEFIPSAARNWVVSNVFVNVLRIGVTDTRIHGADKAKDLQARAALIPAGRMATPTEMAEALFWLGSEANAYITGQTVDAGGGE